MSATVPWVVRLRAPPSSFFSLGGLLRRLWPGARGHVPWIAVALVLAVLGLWDPLTRGGRPDFVLLGLAAYELLISLTQDEGRSHRKG